ncbi:acetolactate synthase small subunit [Gemmatimonas sp.]|jgi:acetolactate synthase-1/3 small subunit|uniref:acetolactate synthase small subunit n=1 Tax=Gemmatimonas sp. TaxID=1962908 RepID=UPI0022CC407F|nr:acetolactate synthase small subunit [Gemmatimonas sp.]MCZ8204651.1 acetolactate synthase small subunit [Gemmatimonas sp.]
MTAPVHTLIALVHDRPGVLHRIVTLLRRRGYNIVSLSVGRSETPGISRLTLAVSVDEATQVVKQLDRLVEVIGVADATDAPTVVRETALLKVRATSAALTHIAEETLAAGGRVLDLGPDEVIVEITDAPERVEQFVSAMRRFGIAELMRTGRLAMMRGPTPRVLEAPNDYRAQADGAPTEEAA